MKNILFALSLLFVTLSLTGQTMDTKPLTKIETRNNYVMSTGVAGYVPAIIMTAVEMKKEEGSSFGDFQIVIYGEAVKQFGQKEEAEKLIEMAKNAGAKLVLCEFAMQKFNMDKSLLPAGLDYVGNAFKHAITLQKQGYYALGL